MNEDKKKARWEENRELIQLHFNELNEKYNDLKKLVAALADLTAVYTHETMKLPAVRTRRPNQIKNLLDEVQKLRD